jgi:hypothetical protein
MDKGDVINLIGKILIPILFLSILLSGCSKPINDIGCPDAVIEWADILMINNIKYQRESPDQADEKVPISLEKGKVIGKVTYKMADHACSNHKMKNGDVAYLEIGTPIYELKGYPANFVVVADDKLYIVDQNKKAKTAGEMYPLRGLIKNIHFESTEDGRRIGTFSKSSTKDFLNEWYQLKLEDYESLYKKKSFEGDRIFLDFELNNGGSFREVYWPNSNTFHFGAIGNDQIKEIIMKEWSKTNKNVGVLP